MKVAFHPFANVFPLIEGTEFESLVADIAEHGQRERIVLHQGKILDGRNRFRACQAAGVAPVFTVFGWPTGFELPVEVLDAALACRPLTRKQQGWLPEAASHLSPAFTRDGAPGDALGYVISLNLRRRHLDESQRAMAAAAIADLGVGANQHSGGVSATKAAALLNVGGRSVERARAVRKRGSAELTGAVATGRISVSAAAAFAKLTDRELKDLVVRGPAEIMAAYKRIRALEQDRKKARREKREADLGARQLALPDRRYGVIYADPEWRFEPYSRETGLDRAADNHYPTSSTAAIAERPVASIAATDCALFLWATSPMLQDALSVMRSWGFTYRSQVVWKKIRSGNARGSGYWFTGEHELLLLGTRGSVPAPAPGEQWPSVIEAPVADHSEKPDVFAELIEEYFPTLPKIELNARRARPGWDVWGLEAPHLEAAE